MRASFETPHSGNKEYQAAKRKLIRLTTEASQIVAPSNSYNGNLLERLEQGDVDDDETKLFLAMQSHGKRDDDWWLDDLSANIGLACVDGRNRFHPEMPPPTIFVYQPELTERFHLDLRQRERFAIATVILGDAQYCFEEAEMMEPQRRRLLRFLDDMQSDLTDELTNPLSSYKRRNFSTL